MHMFCAVLTFVLLCIQQALLGGTRRELGAMLQNMALSLSRISLSVTPCFMHTLCICCVCFALQLATRTRKLHTRQIFDVRQTCRRQSWAQPVHLRRQIHLVAPTQKRRARSNAAAGHQPTQALVLWGTHIPVRVMCFEIP